MAESKTKNAASLGCAILFCLPFLLGGLFALGAGIYEYTETQRFSEDVLGPVGVGSIFTLVGGGLMVALVWAARKEKELEGKKAQYPDTPWLWRDDWAAGRVNPATPGGMIVYWIFGVVFSSVSVPIFFQLDEVMKEAPAALLVFLFPLVGLGMLGGAIYTTLRWFKYGKNWCDLVSNPGVIGGWFRAVIWANVDLSPQDTVTVTVSCFHCYTTGSGKNRTSHRNVEWQESLKLTREHLASEQDGMVAIPVRVYIPRDCRPSTPGWPTDRREWEIKATAEVPGIDFATDFIVPVFVTPESSDTPPTPEEMETLPVFRPDYKPSIDIVEGVDSVEFYASPRRNWSMMLGMTVFGIIWTAIVVGMIYSGEVPILFPIVFGFFDILILMGLVWMWFGHARVRFEHGKVTIVRTVFGMGPTTVVPFEDVTGVDHHIAMRSGNTPYYTVRIKTTRGKKDAIGGIREKAEVEDLVNRIQDLIAGRG